MIFLLELELFADIISKSVKYLSEKGMKSLKVFFLIMLISIKPVYATDDYVKSVQSFGYISGEGLACGAERYPAYELIARAYLVSKAKSDKEQSLGMIKYNQAKAKAYMSKKESGLYDCYNVNQRFNSQKIFNSKLYKDGRLKLPDGKIIVPRKKYDASLLYNRETNEKQKMDEFYNKVIEKKKKKAEKEGIMKKIQQYEKRLH